MSLPEPLLQRVQAYVAPIGPGVSAGQSPRFDPRYERCLAEVSKLDALSGGAPDWKRVVEDGGDVLRTAGKDLLIAAHLAHGLLVLEGLDGLAVGLVTIAELADRYWDGLFPEVKRMRARTNALAWLVERTAQTLEGRPVTAADRAALTTLQAAARRLSGTVGDKFGADAPAMRPLLDAVERLVLSVPADAPVAPAPPPRPAPAVPVPSDSTPASDMPPAVEAAGATPAPAASAVPTTMAVPVVPGSGADPTAALREFGTALASASAQLRRADGSHPAPFRALRTGLWLHLTDLPRATGGKSPVPAPLAALRNQLDRLFANAKWVELVEESESALVQHRLWLDLHRLSAHALASLGPSHAAARTALVGELGSFLRRFPGLLELSFSDGSPVADPLTRGWLDAAVLAVAPTTGSDTGHAASGSSNEEGDAQAEVRRLVGEGKLHEAVARLHARTLALPTGRVRFRLRLLLARTLLDAGQPAAARPWFVALDEELRSYNLDAWDPSLAATCVAGHLQCVRALVKAGSATGQEVAVLYDHLCRLDPVLALKGGA